MHIKSMLVSLVLASAVTLPAQRVVTGGPNEFGPIGVTAIAGPMPAISGAPYTAEAVTEHTQTLADGNRINQTITSQVARDSQGRVRREESLPGPANAPHLILIDDPVAGVHWTLNPTNKTAVQLPVKLADKMILDTAQASAQKIAAAEKMALSVDGPQMTVAVAGGGPVLKDNAGGNEITKTDLGTQTIEGVQAQGTKITHTIPAGQVGNDQPILITTETWRSADLKVLVMSKTSDPRMGDTTYRLTNIVRGEPDPALFQVPSDYTIQDRSRTVTDH